MDDLSYLAGLGEDPADLQTDTHPYLRLLQAVSAPPSKAGGGYLELAQRRLRTRRLTPGGLPQAPEIMGVDADARVPNVLQPMSGEMTAGGEVSGGVPAFHNPTEPPSTGVASQETVAAGLLQQGRNAGAPDAAALAILRLAGIAPIGNERGMDAAPPRTVFPAAVTFRRSKRG